MKNWTDITQARRVRRRPPRIPMICTWSIDRASGQLVATWSPDVPGPRAAATRDEPAQPPSYLLAA